jgi:hypothetical protein
MRLNPSKCKFGTFDIMLLGHLDDVGIWRNPNTMVVIQCFLIPTTPTNMRAFLGFTSYDKNFIIG